MSPRPNTRTVLARLGQALGLLLAVGTLHADQAAFEKANTLYKDGKHAEAAEAYLELSQTGVSANLLFNMGNAYFKAGELGRALAAYQRALHLAPRHPDIMVNLRIAQRKALTEPLPLSLRQQWLRKLSLGEWTASASFCGTLFLILLTVRQVWPDSGVSNILWTRLSAVATAVATLLLVMAVSNFSVDQRAFAVRDGVVVHSNPVEQSPELFQATDGMEFLLLERSGDFVNVRSGNGSVGWIHASDIALTHP